MIRHLLSDPLAVHWPLALVALLKYSERFVMAVNGESVGHIYPHINQLKDLPQHHSKMIQLLVGGINYNVQYSSSSVFRCSFSKSCVLTATVCSRCFE